MSGSRRFFLPKKAPPTIGMPGIWSVPPKRSNWSCVHRTDARLFLFTSYRQMQALYEILADSLPYPCMMQGKGGGKSRLLEEFKMTPNAVLFATASFWQGVDVKGEALSAVIIDKLPFQVPSDPLVAARTAHIQQAGGNPFSEYQVPNAILRLKQGFGRLIRSTTDRGILAVLDNRLREHQIVRAAVHGEFAGL